MPDANDDPRRMKLVEWAEVYCRRYGMRHRQQVYAARRFERAMGPMLTGDITTQHLNHYRQLATAGGLKPETIESGLKYVCRLVGVATGQQLERGDKLPVKRRRNYREPTADSELIRAAEAYVVEHDLGNRNVVANCGRWQRLLGIVPIADISESHFEQFRTIADENGFTSDTIRKTLISVKSVVKSATGQSFNEMQIQKQRRCEPDLVKAAEAYVAEGGLRSRIIVSNAKRFCRIVGNVATDAVTKDHLKHFRANAMELGLSHTTIEKGITDVCTLVKHSTETILNPGRRLKRKRQNPKPVALETIERLFVVSPAWLQQWMVLTFWTAFRLADSMRLQKMLQDGALEVGESFTFQASKTWKEHTLPVPEWLRGWLKPCDLPFRSVNAHSARVIRGWIVKVCEQADVPTFTPKQLRQRGVVQWMRSNGAAGAIVHGKSLGVCDHYVPPIEILEAAASGVVVPECFKLNDLFGERELPPVPPVPPEDDDAEIVKLMQQLDGKTRRLLMQTMKSMLGQA